MEKTGSPVVETLVEGADVSGEAGSGERVALFLEPKKLPLLRVTDERGVTHTRTVGLAGLLGVLDRSAVLAALKRAALRETFTPELPGGAMFAGAVETPEWTEYVATGWLPPRTQPFVWQGRSYAVRTPVIAWRASWRGDEGGASGRLSDLRVAVASPEVGAATADTPLYRWPFANVYASDSFARACWYTMGQVELAFKDVVRLGVEGFLSVKDNGDLFGIGESQNSPYSDYAEFLGACQENGGVKAEWLIPHGMPHGMTLGEFHVTGGKEG